MERQDVITPPAVPAQDNTRRTAYKPPAQRDTDDLIECGALVVSCSSSAERFFAHAIASAIIDGLRKHTKGRASEEYPVCAFGEPNAEDTPRGDFGIKQIVVTDHAILVHIGAHALLKHPIFGALTNCHDGALFRVAEAAHEIVGKCPGGEGYWTGEEWHVAASDMGFWVPRHEHSTQELIQYICERTEYLLEPIQEKWAQAQSALDALI